MKIDSYSVVSLLVEMYIDGSIEPIGKGTAFTTIYKNQNYLITNWHIVTGRNPDNKKPIDGPCDPDYMLVFFFGTKVGLWKQKKIRLRDENGLNLWIEHPLQNFVDVVAIPFILKDKEIHIQNLDLESVNLPFKIYPSKEVSIIGYPFGLSAGGKFPIWKKGHIASEMDLDFENKPIFLIDATTRSGMSGSPVILRVSGFIETENGIEYKGNKHFTKFLGIYSGRIEKESEIGRVWKPIVITQILENVDINLLTRTII